MPVPDAVGYAMALGRSVGWRVCFIVHPFKFGDMKITKTEREIINALRDGAILITTNESAWVQLWKKNNEVRRISPKVFWNLYQKEIIYQDMKKGYDYVLNKNVL